MPYEWVRPMPEAPVQAGAFGLSGGGTRAGGPADLPRAAPLAELHLWPHRSLAPKGFAAVIMITAALLALPLLAVLGSPVLWGLLPFLAAALAGLWYAISRNNRDRGQIEVLRLWHDRLHLSRHDPGRSAREWQANPYWIRLALHGTGGPVPQYLTLSGAGREVELGAFLDPAERQALHDELLRVIGRLRAAASGDPDPGSI